MGDRLDKRKTEAFREAARARAVLQWTHAARAAHGDLTREKMKAPGVSAKIADRSRAALSDPAVLERHVANTRAAMADPEIRSRISVNTKVGMQRWRAGLLAALVETWRRSPKSVRREFLATVGIEPAPIGAGSPPTDNPYVEGVEISTASILNAAAGGNG
jgi:hypothetical protein